MVQIQRVRESNLQLNGRAFVLWPRSPWFESNAPGSRLFGSVVMDWFYDQGARGSNPTRQGVDSLAQW